MHGDGGGSDAQVSDGEVVVDDVLLAVRQVRLHDAVRLLNVCLVLRCGAVQVTEECWKLLKARVLVGN